MRFAKMHGNGNDYLLINCFDEYVRDPQDLALTMCREHTGVGADGLVLVEPGETTPFAMRIFNRDGSEAEMCGNAARCVGKYLYERGFTKETELELSTKAGLKMLSLHVQENTVQKVTVDMGTPDLKPDRIPVSLPGEVVLRHRIQVLGQMWFISCVNLGNPHCVVFVRDPEVLDLPSLGPMFEHHPLFPQHTNVEFVRVVDRGTLQMRVWERGSGETLACATGASASLVAAVLCGHCDRTIRMMQAGGTLLLNWNADTNHIIQTGDAAFVFEGEWTSQ